MTQSSTGSQANFDEGAAQSLIGKRVLVGLTRCNQAGDVVGYEQFHGAIVRVSASEGIIVQVHNSGEERWLPPDLSRLEAASPGSYRLKSTGEVVVDPDLLSTWTVYPPSSKS